MDGATAYNPRTLEEVFRDFKGRRAGMIKALTSGYFFSFSFISCSALSLFLPRCFYGVFFGLFLDVEEFYQQCDPGKRFSLVKGF